MYSPDSTFPSESLYRLEARNHRARKDNVVYTLKRSIQTTVKRTPSNVLTDTNHVHHNLSTPSTVGSQQGFPAMTYLDAHLYRHHFGFIAVGDVQDRVVFCLTDKKYS